MVYMNNKTTSAYPLGSSKHLAWILIYEDFEEKLITNVNAEFSPPPQTKGKKLGCC